MTQLTDSDLMEMCDRDNGLLCPECLETFLEDFDSSMPDGSGRAYWCCPVCGYAEQDEG